jgi:hypothetical protein
VAMRVDARHVFQGGPPAAIEEPIDSTPPPPAAIDSAGLAAELHMQATQLSGYFDNRQAELDRREAEVNARIARLENEERRTRLWLDERRAELAEQQARTGHQPDAQRRLDRIMQAESLRQKYEQQRHSDVSMARRLMRNVERLRQSLEDRGAITSVGGGTSDKDERRQVAELKTQLAAAERRAAELASELATERSNRAATASHSGSGPIRATHLDELETRLAQEAQQLKAEREYLSSERKKWQTEREAGHADMARQRTLQDADLARRRDAVARQQAALASRKAALDRLRDDLQAAQRELCEIRLATEETWEQLTGRVPSAHLTHALAEVRRRLAEQYSAESARLHEQRQELERVRETLATQLARVKADREAFQDWAKRRQADVEQQAARLVAREQQLDEQEVKFQDAALKWRDQQRGYQREIRRLLAELGQSAPVGAD